MELLLEKLRGKLDRSAFESAVQQHEADEEQRAEERKQQREEAAKQKRSEREKHNNKAAVKPLTYRCTRCENSKPRNSFREQWHKNRNKHQRHIKMVCLECEV